MNEVSVFGSVTLLKNGVSVSVSLIPTKLLQQTFNGEKVTPDWGEAANQPVIYPFVMVSNTSVPVTDLSNPTWIFGGRTLTFNADGDSTNSGLVGMFKKISYTIGSTPVPALQITGNVMNGYTTHQKLVLNIDATIGGNTENVSDGIDILRFENPGDTYVGSIEFTNGGVLTPGNTTTTLAGSLTLGGIAVTEKVTYSWKKWNGTTWVSTGKTTRSITVGLDDVDSQARYMLEFSVDGSVVTNAYFTVRDLSDPLEIVIDQPVDAMIGSGESLTYTAVVRRVGTADNLPGYTFNYTLLKLDGTEISSGVATGGKFTITGQQLLDNGGTINWSVTATK
ncbi:hypothetical protein [Butyricimonas virosa]|uniref:hypothetical protein n=1 Tax=Butyricimonas virosa TaxID=544645 RepID=UPI0032C0BDCA|nr:hypothetical protein [Porphyromonadaceae bacterium]